MLQSPESKSHMTHYFWKKSQKNHQKSPFWGKIKSPEEIRALKMHIHHHEQKDLEAFEADMKKQLKNL